MGRRTIRTMYDALEWSWVGFLSQNQLKCKARHQADVMDLAVP